MPKGNIKAGGDLSVQEYNFICNRCIKIVLNFFAVLASILIVFCLSESKQQMLIYSVAGRKNSSKIHFCLRASEFIINILGKRIRFQYICSKTPCEKSVWFLPGLSTLPCFFAACSGQAWTSRLFHSCQSTIETVSELSKFLILDAFTEMIIK